MDPLRNFGFLLRDISRLYAANFERHATGLNLTLPQCRVLCYLERNEGISQARLAELTDTDPMTLVRILDRMENDGLVERRTDPSDRRTRRLHLRTPALAVLKEIWRVSDRARAESFARMAVADRDLLLNLLQQMQANLQALVPEDAEPSRLARAAPRAARKRPPRAPAKRSARLHAHAKA